MSGTNHQYKY